MLRLMVFISTVVASLSAQCPTSNRYKWPNGEWIEAGICYHITDPNKLTSIKNGAKYVRFECHSLKAVIQNEFTNEVDCIGNNEAAILGTRNRWGMRSNKYLSISECVGSECVDESKERFLKVTLEGVAPTQDGTAEVLISIGGRKSVEQNEPNRVQFNTSSWFNYGIIAIVILIVLFISSL